MPRDIRVRKLGGASLGPVTFDTFTTGSTNGGTQITYSHTVAAGSNRKLYIAVSLTDGLLVGSVVTDCSFAGNALTPVVETLFGAAGEVSIWELKDPPVGLGTVIVNFTDAIIANCSSIGFYNVPVGTVHTAIGGGVDAAPTVTITNTVAGNFLLDCMGAEGVSTAITASVSAGQTQMRNLLTGPAIARLRGTDSRFQSAGGSKALSWSLSAVKQWGMCACEVVY